MMMGRASGVWSAALWNRTMEPGWTLEVTRRVISPADKSFQSRESPPAAASRGDLRAQEARGPRRVLRRPAGGQSTRRRSAGRWAGHRHPTYSTLSLARLRILFLPHPLQNPAFFSLDKPVGEVKRGKAAVDSKLALGFPFSDRECPFQLRRPLAEASNAGAFIVILKILIEPLLFLLGDWGVQTGREQPLQRGEGIDRQVIRQAPEVDAQPRTNQIGLVQGWVIQPGQGGVILAQQLHLVLGKGV